YARTGRGDPRDRVARVGRPRLGQNATGPDATPVADVLGPYARATGGFAPVANAAPSRGACGGPAATSRGVAGGKSIGSGVAGVLMATSLVLALSGDEG